VIGEIGRTVPAGALAWAKRNRPDLLAAVDQAEARLTAAYEVREGTALSTAAQEFLRAYQAIAAAFAAQEDGVDPPPGTRPPG
jgi:hypothetical protein